MTPAKAKRHSVRPSSRSGRPSTPPVDDPEQLSSGTRIKRAEIHGAREREEIEASIEAALRELDSLEAGPRKPPGRRVPPFPGTGRTQALPLLPSMRPPRSSRPKKGG